MSIYTCEIPKMTIEIFRGRFILRWEKLRQSDFANPASSEEWPKQRNLAIYHSRLEKHEGLPGSFVYTLNSYDMLLGAVSIGQQNIDTITVDVQAMPWAADLWFDEIVTWLKSLEAPEREDPYQWALARRKEGMAYSAIFDGWAERYIAMYGEDKYYRMNDPYEAMTRHLRRVTRN